MKIYILKNDNDGHDIDEKMGIIKNIGYNDSGDIVYEHHMVPYNKSSNIENCSEPICDICYCMKIKCCKLCSNNIDVPCISTSYLKCKKCNLDTCYMSSYDSNSVIPVYECENCNIFYYICFDCLMDKYIGYLEKNKDNNKDNIIILDIDKYILTYDHQFYFNYREDIIFDFTDNYSIIHKIQEDEYAFENGCEYGYYTNYGNLISEYIENEVDVILFNKNKTYYDLNIEPLFTGPDGGYTIEFKCNNCKKIYYPNDK